MLKIVLALAVVGGAGIGAYAVTSSAASRSADEPSGTCPSTSPCCAERAKPACDDGACPTAGGELAGMGCRSEAAAACSGGKCEVECDDEGDECEEEVSLDALPKGALDAAKAKLPGFVASCAEKETENGKVVYSICGTVNGKCYEIEVAEDGTILEVEEECDDEDGEDADE